MTLALRRPVPRQLLQLLLLLLGLDRAVDASKPNFVIFLQDDQDFLNGRDGLRPMTKTLELIADKGILAENWFIHTPVCCPSRAELLSGRYFHNLRMPNGTGGGCMHVQTGVAGMEDKPNEHSFAKYLVQERGYTAAWFGKHLNSMNGRHPPPPGYGCKTCHWFTNGGGSDTEPGGYYMPSFSDFYGGVPTAVNGTFSKNGSWSSWGPGAPVTADGMRVPAYGGYWTSIVGNMSIDWLHKIAGPTVERDAEGYLTTPFVLTVAPKAPHYAATPAPWYDVTRGGANWVDAEEVKAPRTASFGVDPSQLAGHHQMIAEQPHLMAHERNAVDRQFRKRWVTLLSVDDAIAAVSETLDELKLAASTYFFVTSDHGYNMGQHNLPSCKLNVYDNTVRIPMLIRGPGIKAQQSFTQIGSNVDVAPTLLALAGLDPMTLTTPPMDGKSLMPWLLAGADDGSGGGAAGALLLPSVTRAQLAVERARLGVTAADTAESLPRVRAAHWIEFYSLGNLHMCGGGSFNGSAYNTSQGCGPGCPGTGHDPLAPDLIIGSTCQGDRPDMQGYCHSPCHHTSTGALPMKDPSCDLKVCVNVTCCGANHTEFSALEGMRCGAGHKNGSLPFDTSMDPGHQVDSTESNTYRALRFVDPTPGDAEFTRLSDYDFSAPDVFVEIFDVEKDPGQLVNLVNETTAEDMAFYKQMVREQFACAGKSCK